MCVCNVNICIFTFVWYFVFECSSNPHQFCGTLHRLVSALKHNCSSLLNTQKFLVKQYSISFALQLPPKCETDDSIDTERDKPFASMYCDYQSDSSLFSLS